MSKWFKIGMVAAIVAAVAIVSLGVVTTFAQGPTPTVPGYGGMMGFGMGWGGGMGGPQNSLVAVAAKVLGMDQTALVTELNAGKTIADVAKAKNVALDKIVNAFMESRTAAMKAAVDAKRITQAQADANLATMKAHVLEELNAKFTAGTYGRGMGMGMGAGFVDANKDGVCDLCGATRPAGTTQPGQMMGRGRWSR